MGYYNNLEINTMQEVEKFLDEKNKLFYWNGEIIFEVFADWKDKKFTFKDLKVKKVLKAFEMIIEDIKENCFFVKNNDEVLKWFDVEYFLYLLDILNIKIYLIN